MPVRPAYRLFNIADMLRQQGCPQLADLYESAGNQLAAQIAVLGIGGLTGWERAAAALDTSEVTGITDTTSPRTPVGHSGGNLNVVPGEGTTALNSPATIAGRQYTGHALDQMQSRGIVPSAVENTIQHGQEMVGKRAGTTAYYDPENNITVIVDTQSGRVITAVWGLVKQ